MEMGYSVLTLEEALQTFDDGEESMLFNLKLKLTEHEENVLDSTAKLNISKGRLIRLRKLKVTLGEGK
jgi:hypothetical protein